MKVLMQTEPRTVGNIMTQAHKLFAGCLGIGHLKGGGTVAAIICCGLWYLVQPGGQFKMMMIPVTAVILLTGIWSSGVVETSWGKDSSRIVIDEVAGMCTSLLFVPVTVKYLVTGLVLFRFFDIVKPFLVSKAESLPHGWGVMMDDVLAGVYTNLVLQLLIYFTIF